jgi:hypothetical protein
VDRHCALSDRLDAYSVAPYGDASRKESSRLPETSTPSSASGSTVCREEAVGEVEMLSGRLSRNAETVDRPRARQPGMGDHGNVRIPERIDRVLRRFVVTPTCTTCITRSRRTSFGFNLPWWDRLFGPYREAARVLYSCRDRLGPARSRGSQERSRTPGTRSDRSTPG